ncbi:MAG: hypothetical protein GXY43_00355 [Clostridiaceae bacterium]|nr:hypothetical protein [Clostridiaceae bacterium]
MTYWVEVIIRALPIFLLIGLGMILRKTKTISENTIPEIKKLIVHVTLPAMLLLTFAKTRFRAEYGIIFLIMFLFCCLMLFAGIRIGPKISPKNRFYPALFTGFEAGMMGYALFSVFFGGDGENNYAFAVVDIGQVLFVFFVLALFLRKKSGSDASLLGLLKGFALSPIIICILTGILLGSTGLYDSLEKVPGIGAVEETLILLGAMTQPLICLVIGYDLRFRFSRLLRPLLTVLGRLAVMILAAFLINTLVIDRLLGLEPIFQVAVFTMFILPPPFVIPVYFGKASDLEKEEILDTLSLHTVASLFGFMLLLSVLMR